MDPGAQDEILETWSGLYASDTGACFSTSPRFAKLVSSTFGAPNASGACIAYRGRVPVAILPVSVNSRPAGPFTIRRLTHWNGHHTYDGSIICLPEEVGHSDAALLAWTMKSFRYWNEVDVWRSRTVGTVPPAQLIPDPVVDLASPGSTSESTQQRTDRKRRARLVKDPDYEVVVATAPVDVTLYAKHFASLHTRLKTAQAQWRVFEATPQAADRFPASLSQLALDGHAATVSILHRGRPIGIQVLMFDQHAGLAWRSAWDPDYSRQGIGIALVHETVDWARTAGLRTLRLGPGSEDYKQRWSTSSTSVGRYRAARRTMGHVAERLCNVLRSRNV